MSGSKSARNQASIVNRTNVCGGPKKAGTGPRVGWFLSSEPFLLRVPQGNPPVCIPNGIALPIAVRMVAARKPFG